MPSNRGRYAVLRCSRINNGFWTECHLHRYFTTDITCALVELLSPRRLEIYTLVEHALSISYRDFRNLLTRVYGDTWNENIFRSSLRSYCSDFT